jgi:predicted PurR-regulated permease PerM
MEINEQNLKKFFAISIIILLFVLSFFVLKPILISIIMGFVLAFIFHPLYKKFVQWTKSETLSAFLICFVFLIIIIIPLYFMLPIAVRQIFQVYSSLQTFDFSSFLGKIFPSVFSSPDISATFATSINSVIGSLVSSTINGFMKYLAESPVIIVNFFAFIFVFFLSLKHAGEIVVYIKEISPFSQAYEDRIFNRFKDTTNALIFGNIIAGVVQGLSTGIMLLILGFPNILLLTLFAIFLAIIPIGGAYLVWVPAAIYLFVKGNITGGIILSLYGIIVISWIDNFIRAFIVSKKTKINSGIIFVSMMGGILVFGFFGIIIGPLIISYLLLVLELYKENKLIEKS